MHLSSPNHGTKVLLFLAGRFKLQDLLLAEFASIKKAIVLKISKSKIITMCLDGWTSISNQSLYACNLIFEDSTCVLWDVVDFSGVIHSGTVIAGKLSLRIIASAHHK